jgi:hypothetical protein
MALGPTSRALQDQPHRCTQCNPINAVTRLCLPGQSGSSPRTTRSAWRRSVRETSLQRRRHY